MAIFRRVRLHPVPILVLATLAAAGALLGPGSASGAAAPTPATACTTEYPPPDGAASTGLAAISFDSPDDGWAVGPQPYPPAATLAAWHWTGGAWHAVAVPSAGQRANLYAVAALAPDDAWAVGFSADSTDPNEDRTLILHWDGHAWQIVAIPGPGSQGTLRALAATGPGDVWAAGSYHDPALAAERSYILHWDGARWTPATLPVLDDSQRLVTIAAASATDIWAAGYYLSGPPFRLPSDPLYLHWDGSTWQVATPPPRDLLHGEVTLTAFGPGQVWAAGWPPSALSPIVLHWDGTTWTPAAVPAIADVGGTGGTFALSAAGPNDIWLAAPITIKGIRLYDPTLLVLHWDGQAWQRLMVDTAAPDPVPYGVAALPGGRAWVVGTQRAPNAADFRPLLLHLDAQPCPAATPTPVPPLPPVPLPGSGSQTFPETGKTATGLFLDYWRSHGGLMQQGYPISDLLGEVSPLDGKLYTVQYFERGVFEYHPENQPPYNVLLSQLGTFAYHTRYPGGAPNERPNQDPGTVVFPETGKALGGAFLQYWQAHGGLVQQGYPISDEFTEVSPIDGHLYTVQYFERAVFEYHPENAPPYNVLLSLLGRLRYDSAYRAPAAGATTPQPLVLADRTTGAVAANSHAVYWVVDTAPAYPVRGYDLTTHQPFLLSARPGPKAALTADDGAVAWVEGDPAQGASIQGVDLAAHVAVTLLPVQAPNALHPEGLALAGDAVYYAGGTGAQAGIHRRNWRTGADTLVVANSDAVGPAVAGEAVLFDERGTCGSAPCAG